MSSDDSADAFERWSHSDVSCIDFHDLFLRELRDFLVIGDDFLSVAPSSDKLLDVSSFEEAMSLSWHLISMYVG